MTHHYLLFALKKSSIYGQVLIDVALLYTEQCSRPTGINGLPYFSPLVQLPIRAAAVICQIFLKDQFMDSRHHMVS